MAFPVRCVTPASSKFPSHRFSVHAKSRSCATRGVLAPSCRQRLAIHRGHDSVASALLVTLLNAVTLHALVEKRMSRRELGNIGFSHETQCGILRNKIPKPGDSKLSLVILGRRHRKPCVWSCGRRGKDVSINTA